MKQPIFSLLLAALASCSSQQKEQEPDYDNMVMVDEEEWITDEERDRKIIAGDPPDPQELIILDTL